MLCCELRTHEPSYDIVPDIRGVVWNDDVLVNIMGLDVCREECVVGDRVHSTGVDHVWPGHGCLAARGGVVQVCREKGGGAVCWD